MESASIGLDAYSRHSADPSIAIDPHSSYSNPAIKVSSIFALPKNSNLLPHQATLLRIGDPFIELPTVDSTNNYAMGQVQKAMAKHGTVYFAHNQTAGKGQRGKSWTTKPGENLILSVVIVPIELTLFDTFYLSAGITIACYDFFKNYAGEETSIKWPNDLYWRDRKAGGILIENVIRNDVWKYSIIGIGININQTEFPSELVNPISLKQITGSGYHTVQLAKELCTQLERRYQFLKKEKTGLLSIYNQNLYKRDQRVKLKKTNIIFETIVSGVSSTGKLITRDTMEREFGFGEVEWI
ncbi:MAG: biotin--[acetyl-CoA-carboxylase] ligase [Flavitalea sp.]